MILIGMIIIGVPGTIVMIRLAGVVNIMMIIDMMVIIMVAVDITMVIIHPVQTQALIHLETIVLGAPLLLDHQ
jgi:hypothetical protein